MIHSLRQPWRTALLLTAPFLGVATVGAAPQSTSSQSLEDLGDNLLDDREFQQTMRSAGDPDAGNEANDASNLLPDIDALRRMLEPEVPTPPAGEDLGHAGESPLARISQRMSHAGELIAAQNTSGKTRAVQEEIVSELDKLIEQLNKQCQQCSSGQCSKPSEQQTQGSTPKPGGGKPAASAAAQSAPQQSQVSPGAGGEAQPGEVADGDVVKQLWGELPDRLRQQLLQSTADEFLPKYREDIEMYFRRLAEEQSGDGADN